MSNKDELYIKVVVLNEIYNFVVYFFLFKIIWIYKYTQDFIELIPKESICYIVPSECVVVVKDLRWRSDQIKSCRSQKVMQHCSLLLFYLKSL
jgi:hypothetical protein